MDYIQLVSQQGLGRTSCCLCRLSPQPTVKANFCLTVLVTNCCNTAELMRRHWQEASDKLNHRQQNKLLLFLLLQTPLTSDHLEAATLQADYDSSTWMRVFLLSLLIIPSQQGNISLAMTPWKPTGSSQCSINSIKCLAHHHKQPLSPINNPCVCPEVWPI